MKVPLETEPFKPVVLSPGQGRRLAWLADEIVNETLAEYDDFALVHHRKLSPKAWKSVVTRENVTIYKRIGNKDLGGCTPDISLVDTSSEPRTIHWRVPGVVGLGSLVGTMDDLLYGWLALDDTESRIRSYYIKDEAVDGRVLNVVCRPTESDPLRVLLVRWQLFVQPIHRLGVSPRDVVNMESIGTRVLPNGERLGYICVQSVDVPGCDELRSLGILRCKFSSCFLFRDCGNGSIDLFMRGFIDPGGRLGDTIAIFSMCVSLITSWRLIIACQNKKLAWVVRKARHSGPLSQTTSASNTVCSVCTSKKSDSWGSIRCEACFRRVCKRCFGRHKLVFAEPSGQLQRVSSSVCKSCALVAAKSSARHVASCEQGSLPYTGSTWISSYNRDTLSSIGTVSSSHDPDIIGMTSPYGPVLEEVSSSCCSEFSQLSVDILPSPQEIQIAQRRDGEASAAFESDQLKAWLEEKGVDVADEEPSLATRHKAKVDVQHSLA